MDTIGTAHMTHPDLITAAIMHAAADESVLARDVRALVAELRKTRAERDGLRVAHVECEDTMIGWAKLVEALRAELAVLREK